MAIRRGACRQLRSLDVSSNFLRKVSENRGRGVGQWMMDGWLWLGEGGGVKGWRKEEEHAEAPWEHGRGGGQRQGTPAHMGAAAAGVGVVAGVCRRAASRLRRACTTCRSWKSSPFRRTASTLRPPPPSARPSCTAPCRGCGCCASPTSGSGCWAAAPSVSDEEAPLTHSLEGRRAGRRAGEEAGAAARGHARDSGRAWLWPALSAVARDRTILTPASFVYAGWGG